MTREEKANELAQKYFPDANNIWARPNLEAEFVKQACLEMANWVEQIHGITMIQNGIIINGVAYEFTSREVQGNDCEGCALRERCHEMLGGFLCGALFENYINKTFKRVEKWHTVRLNGFYVSDAHMGKYDERRTNGRNNKNLSL